MNFVIEQGREGHRKSEDDPAGANEAPRATRRRKGETAQVGDALRTVYQRAVEEDIPPEMLDLLGKLG